MRWSAVLMFVVLAGSIKCSASADVDVTPKLGREASTHHFSPSPVTLAYLQVRLLKGLELYWKVIFLIRRAPNLGILATANPAQLRRVFELLLPAYIAELPSWTQISDPSHFFSSLTICPLIMLRNQRRPLPQLSIRPSGPSTSRCSRSKLR
jgi:hypothetical protein